MTKRKLVLLDFNQCQETELHLAVLEENYQKMLSLCENRSLQEQVNGLGFTPLELAQLLGKQGCIDILQPKTRQRHIKVRLEHQTESQMFSKTQFRNLFNVSYRSHLHFSNYNSLQEVISNCPLILKYGPWGEENRQLGVRYKNEISQGFVADVAIQWVNSEIGYGLFADTDLTPGAYVGEYTGLVRRLYRLHPNQNAYCFHYPTAFWSWKYYVIDSLFEGNQLRFINHSNLPNLQPACLVDRGLLHLILVTKRAISHGEELTFDYGPDYWIRRKQIILN